MHVLNKESHNYFKNNVKDRIYKVFNREVEKRRSIQTIEEWAVYKEKLLDVFNKAFPEDIFKKNTNIKYKIVSKYEFTNFKIENVLIESIEGWFINATVYLPKEKGKYYGIVCPTGHSSKTYENYVKSNQILAQNGYITISFDPPGMKGEHEYGNDHFTDGVLSFLSGFWSNTYFVLDAIRCIDYLEQREDVIKGSFGMTGISGGGTTTIFASIIDERIKASAPVCCVSNSLHHILEENYTICPETSGHNFHKYALDSESLLSLIEPKPLLLIGGKKDEILNYKLAIQSMKYVKQIYKLSNKQKNCQYFIDENAGHEYSLSMLKEVSTFFNKHLKKINQEGLNIKKEEVYFIEKEKLLCHPKDTISIRLKNQLMFKNKKRSFDKKDIEKLMLKQQLVVKKSYETISPTKWFHTIHKRVYEINSQYKLPAIVLKRQNTQINNVLLFFTDDNKWTHFINDGFLAKAGGFLQKEPILNEKNIISVDLSGFGELEVEGDGYDLAQWCTQLRNLSYELLFFGESVLETRVQEIFTIIKHVEKSKEYKKIYLVGKGKAAIPTLIAAYLYGKSEKTTLINMPISFETLTKHVPNQYLPDSIYFDAPNNFELYDIANKTKNIVLINPKNGDYSNNVDKVNKLYNSNVKIIYTKENEYEI